MSAAGKKWGSVGAVIVAIIGTVFALEGGYSDNPADPGGKTNHGVTEQVARANGYQGDMKALPKGFAEQVYRRDYIERPNFHRVIPLFATSGIRPMVWCLNDKTTCWQLNVLHKAWRCSGHLPQGV